MKKNLITVIILALVLANLILTHDYSADKKIESADRSGMLCY